MGNGKISIIMGIYNCSKTLPEAIDSILAQTYENWELIMCDDASTDDTYKIAEEYKNKYPEKIILIRNEKNSKLAFTLNHCLKYATGEFVARMDGDDISVPERFEKQIQFLKENPDIHLVGSSMQRFNEDGLHDIVSLPENVDKYILRTKSPFNHATILTYKYVYDELEGYTVAERTMRAQDMDLWFRFYHKGFVGVNLQEPLYLVREDENAIRRRTAKVRINAFKTARIGFKLLDYPKWWIVEKFIVMVIKCLIPYFIVDKYREFQAKKK